jgi:ABC-type branched-subunit amino acid transport system substrate-binding protein
VPAVAYNLASYNTGWRYVYSAGDAQKQARPMVSFIKNVIGDANGKTGVIYTNDPLNIAVKTGFLDEAKKTGMTISHVEAVAPNQNSFVAELSRMRDSQATSVALLVNTGEVLGILRDAKALNFQPNWTGSYWPIDETSQGATALFQGIKVIRNYSSTNSPAYAPYVEKAKKYGRDSITNSTTMALYGMALSVGQVLQNVGATPTRDKVAPAIEVLVNYNNQITMALSFGPGKRIADVGMWPLQCCNSDGTWRGIGPAKTRF